MNTSSAFAGTRKPCPPGHHVTRRDRQRDAIQRLKEDMERHPLPDRQRREDRLALMHAALDR